MIRSFRNFIDVPQMRASAHPERVALRFLGDGENETCTITYAQLFASASAVAARLQSSAAVGDRALLLYPSGPEYVAAFLGCLLAGVIAVPACPPESGSLPHLKRLLAIINDATPQLVLTQSELVAPLEAARSMVPALASVGLLATDELEPREGAEWRCPSLTPDAVAFLQYTSGSTASPKGVVVSHANLLANELVISRAFEMTEADVVVSWLPLFHDMGLIGGLLQPIFSGQELVLIGPQHFMERPLRWLEAIARFRGTVSGAPDFAYRLCVDRTRAGAPPGLDLSSWRLAFCGAEPIRPASLRRFAERFAPAGFDAAALYPCYGLAESTLFVSGGARGSGVVVRSFDAGALSEHQAQEATGGRELVACGRAQADHEVVIVDPESQERVAPGQIGEIQVAGPSVALGYWRNPAASAETFAPREGRTFLRTGDLGFVHEGSLFITGRRKDMLIVRGRNLYPQDLEATIEEQLEVVRRGRVAAFSVLSGDEERIGVAIEVSRRLQKLVDPLSLCREVSEKLAEAHGDTPAVVVLLNPGSMPITSSGKLQRSLCAKRWVTRSFEPFAVYEDGSLTHSAVHTPISVTEIGG
jgi:acyl-CoA synthetase (AMP-forming)/AMP-acid ligase II